MSIDAYRRYDALAKRTGGLGEGHSILEGQKLYWTLQNPATPAYIVRNPRAEAVAEEVEVIKPRAIIQIKPKPEPKPKSLDKMAAK